MNIRKEQVMMYVVVDLEATNDDTGKNRRIIQVGLTFIENRNIQDTLCFDINPSIPIHEHVVKLTGITDEQVKDAPFFEDIADYLYHLLEGCIFVAHNVQFDYSLLKKEFEQAGYPDFSMLNLDTIELSKILFPTEKAYSLGILTANKGILHAEHHHAGSDAKATAELFLLCLDAIEKLPQDVHSAIYTLLSAKGDNHAYLFETAIPLDYQLTCKLPSSLRGALLLNDAEHDKEHEINHSVINVRDMEHTLPEVLRRQASIVLVSNEQSMQDMITLYPTVCVVKREQDYINHFRMAECFHQIDRFSIQEIRQLCAVVHWLVGTQTGDLTEIAISEKLRYWLSYDGVKVNSYYQKMIQNSMTYDVLCCYQDDFIRHFDYFNSYCSLCQRQVIIFDLMQWINQLERTQRQSLCSSKVIQGIQRLKAVLQKKQDVEKTIEITEKLLHIQSILKDYYWVINQLESAYPCLFTDDCESVRTYFVDHFENLNSFWFIRLKNMLNKIKCFFRQQGEDELVQHLEKQESYLVQAITRKKNSDYLLLEIHQKRYAHYSLFAQNILFGQWMNHIYELNTSVLYTTYTPLFSTELKCYVSRLLQAKSLVYQPSKITRQCIVYAIDDFMSVTASKDNLLVKRLSRLIMRLREKVCIIVPNQSLLLKILENCQEATNQNQAMSKKQAFVMTWHDYRQLREPLHVDITQILILKLPFESPVSLEAMVSKSYIQTYNGNYFRDIAFPKMLMTLLDCIFRHENVSCYILDERLLNSTYATKIREEIGKDCLIQVESIASLVK